MLRHACGFKLANDGVDTRTHAGLSSVIRINPAYGALHRAGANSVQMLIPGLTAPAYVASFEATVGGLGCPRLA